MKKLFFTLALALGALSISAQEAGSMWIGGSVGFSSSKVKGSDSQTSYKILPEFGYVLSENLAVGINVGYAHIEGQEVGGPLQESKFDDANAFVVAPFLRYTFLKGDLGGLFVDAGVDYTHEKGKTSKVKSDEIGIGFKPGIAFNISEKVVLTGKFGFLGYEYEKRGSVKTNSFGFNFDMSQILIGASIKF